MKKQINKVKGKKDDGEQERGQVIVSHCIQYKSQSPNHGQHFPTLVKLLATSPTASLTACPHLICTA